MEETIKGKKLYNGSHVLASGDFHYFSHAIPGPILDITIYLYAIVLNPIIFLEPIIPSLWKMSFLSPIY